MKLQLLAALGIALGMLDPVSGGASVDGTEEDVANLTRRSAEANSALIRGDIDGYLALIEHAKDYTLMSPFGGTQPLPSPLVREEVYAKHNARRNIAHHRHQGEPLEVNWPELGRMRVGA